MIEGLSAVQGGMLEQARHAGGAVQLLQGAPEPGAVMDGVAGQLRDDRIRTDDGVSQRCESSP
jgi:hypothetical protein